MNGLLRVVKKLPKVKVKGVGGALMFVATAVLEGFLVGVGEDMYANMAKKIKEETEEEGE